MSMQVGLQLYTLHEEMKKDFVGTLKKVAEIGYRGVEFAGYGGLEASELKCYLDKFGLIAIGSHVPLEQLTDNIDEVIEYNLEIGSSYIIVPGVNVETKEEWIKIPNIFNELAKKCRDKGLVFCYHNHSHEFDVFDGEYALDILYNACDSELVNAEMDIYWVHRAGIDPAKYIQKYSKRCPLIHIKDMEKGESRDSTEVGNGIIDMQAIINVAKKSEVKWLVVEQEHFKRDAIESVAISFENLKRML
ncbi:MAG: sugar phosphate isomerase/epimerase family protein [Alkaliphilus sp.]